jgi:hypothetical protein
MSGNMFSKRSLPTVWLPLQEQSSGVTKISEDSSFKELFAKLKGKLRQQEHPS